jgi:FtsH-binding integral membrane protein
MMNQADFRAETPYANFGSAVIEAPADVRRIFIRKTYTHLAMAVYAFVALEWLMIAQGLDVRMMQMLGGSQWSWLLVMGAFIAVSYIADSWARSTTSIGMQYAGLFLYVLAQAVIFLPMIGMAKSMTMSVGGQEWQVVPAAGLTTAIMFAGLTAYAFLSKQDFSFLGGFLNITMLGSLALIVASIAFGFNLGVWFSVLMIVAACGYILYYTSNIMREYRTDQYVAAALALFASVALLFWYILRIFMSFSNRN